MGGSQSTPATAVPQLQSSIAPQLWERRAREWKRRHDTLQERLQEQVQVQEQDKFQADRRLATARAEQQRLRGTLQTNAAMGGGAGLLLGAAVTAGLMSFLHKKAPAGLVNGLANAGGRAAANLKAASVEALSSAAVVNEKCAVVAAAAAAAIAASCPPSLALHLPRRRWCRSLGPDLPAAAYSDVAMAAEKSWSGRRQRRLRRYGRSWTG